MKFTYTIAPDSELPVSCFKIEVSYEHGVADLTTHHTFTKNDEPSVLEFVDEFLKCGEAVSANWSYGREFSDDILELLEVYGEHDKMAEGVYGYYADMSIKSITYYDPNGVKFNVTIED